MVATMNLDVPAFIDGEIAKSRAALDELDSPHYSQTLTDIANKAVETFRAGGKIMFCGNGGSAADSQHLAAELVGRQNYNRAPAAGFALTVDTSALTAIGNDYGYDTVFSRQVEALGNAGDVLIGISTSGRSAKCRSGNRGSEGKGHHHGVVHRPRAQGHGHRRHSIARAGHRNGEDSRTAHHVWPHRLRAGRAHSLSH